MRKVSYERENECNISEVETEIVRQRQCVREKLDERNCERERERENALR